MRSESEPGVLISSSYTHTQRHVHTAERESVGINCVCSHKYPEVVIFKWHPGAQGVESCVTCGTDLEGPQREHTHTNDGTYNDCTWTHRWFPYIAGYTEQRKINTHSHNLHSWPQVRVFHHCIIIKRNPGEFLFLSSLFIHFPEGNILPCIITNSYCWYQTL